MQLLICCRGQWAGDRGGAALHIGMVIHQSAGVTRSAKKEGRAAWRWQGHQFHETFPPLHLKARHNHAQGRCTMKWNGRPDPGERTQRRVHRNEGHSLPRDASVSGKGPAGPGQAVTQPASWYQSKNFNLWLEWCKNSNSYCQYIHLLKKWHHFRKDSKNCYC